MSGTWNKPHMNNWSGMKQVVSLFPLCPKSFKMQSYTHLHENRSSWTQWTLLLSRLAYDSAVQLDCVCSTYPKGFCLTAVHKNYWSGIYFILKSSPFGSYVHIYTYQMLKSQNEGVKEQMCVTIQNQERRFSVQINYNRKILINVNVHIEVISFHSVNKVSFSLHFSKKSGHLSMPTHEITFKNKTNSWTTQSFYSIIKWKLKGFL